MAHSERKRPWFGKPYTQHYDDAGNKNGRSYDKKNPITNKVKTNHYNEDGSKIGSSENITDAITGKTHTQHYDETGKATAYTEREKGFFGKYKWVTKSGKKRTTQEIIGYLILIGIVIYIIVKVVLPLTFVLLTPILTVVAIVNSLRSKELGYFKYSLITSILFILDYLFNGYSSYLIEDQSFVSKNLHLFLLLAFVCFSISAVGLAFNRISQFCNQMNVTNRSGQIAIAVSLGILLILPYYLIDNKHLAFKEAANSNIISGSQAEMENNAVNQNPVSNNKSGNMIFTGEDSLLLDAGESYMALKFVDVFYCGMYNYLIFIKDNGDSIDFSEIGDFKVDINENEIDFKNDCIWTGNEVKVTTKSGNKENKRVIRRNTRYKAIVKYFGQVEGTLYKNSGYIIVDILPFGRSFPRQIESEPNVGIGQSMFQANAKVNGSAVQLRSDHSTTAQSLKSMKKNDLLQIVEEYVPEGNVGQAILNQKVDFYDQYYSNVTFSLPKGKAVMVEGSLGGNMSRISYFDVKTKTKGYAKVSTSSLEFISGKTWYRVKREDGLTGWVFSEFVDKM